MKKEKKSKTNIGSWRLKDGEQTPQRRKNHQAEESEVVQKRIPKKIAISHYHRIRKPWVILPYGMYYNAELLKAQTRDILLFSDGVEREIEYLTPVKANAGLTDYFCRKTYYVGMNRIKQRWKANLECEGYNMQALEQDRVMLIFLKEIEDKQPVETSKKRKQK